MYTLAYCMERPPRCGAVWRRPAVPKATALYEDLRGDLTNGRWAPGARLSELELVRHYSVSRTPIREALARLEQDGLLERRGSSIYVRERSADEVIDIYRARVYLEGAVA